MTNVQLEKFYKDELYGHLFSGKGIIRDVRRYGQDYTVVVDCLNDVAANVVISSSSAAEELKAGSRVEFSGKCTQKFRRAYRDTQRTYQLFELISGDIK
ncbi:MAG: hypothetical protein WC581_03680 [Thermodesulfovibrionales bacterium]